jgi:predicted alpha/beta hydrolase
MLWLRDFLPGSQGFGNARVMTFDYDHPEWERLETELRAEQWLNTAAESLMIDVVRTRDETNTPRGKPIMFIGHSWGGIIIKMVSPWIFSVHVHPLTMNFATLGFVSSKLVCFSWHL